MRKPRELYIDGLYHVTDKINRDEFIFEDNAMKDLFIYYVERACKKYNAELNNYCIMGNHIHLMIKIQDGTLLPEIMRWIKSGFARAFNKITGNSGHVWKDRYFSRPIKSMSYYYNVFRYISENPVKAGLCKTIMDYAYSALHQIENPPAFLRIPSQLLQWLLKEWVTEGPIRDSELLLSS